MVDGAIYNNGRDSEPTTAFPDDTVFVDNIGEARATFQTMIHPFREVFLP